MQCCISVGVTVWKILKTSKFEKKTSFPYFQLIDDSIIKI